MVERNASSNILTPMKLGVESYFSSLLHNNQFSEAIDYLSYCVNQYPSVSVIRQIIFEMLMNRDCDVRCAIEAGEYLLKVLSIYPPKDNKSRSFYSRALILENNLFVNIWAVFCHLVESCFCHYKIYRITEDDGESSVVQHPNCDILINFYVEVLIKNYDLLSTERTEKSLVQELFWQESSDLSAAKENPKKFLQWMNLIYEHSARISKVEAFRKLHQLLNLMVRCIIDYQFNCEKIANPKSVPDSLVCNSVYIVDIVKNINNTCKEAFASHDDLRGFLHHLSLKYLQFKVCEYKMYELIYPSPPSYRKFIPCTLKTLVTAYMLPKKIGAKRGPKPKKQKEKAIAKEDEKGKKEKETSIAKSSNRENAKQKLNLNIVDDEGMTALHIAVQKNRTDLVKPILRNGGSALLNKKDKKGRKPSHYASNKEMEQLLKEFQPKIEDTNKAPLTPLYTNLEIPPFRTFKDYAIFCHATHFLLALYADIHNLFHLNRLLKNENSIVEICKHELKNCPHYVECSENAICSEDIEYLKALPDIVEHFIRRIIENGKDMSIDLEYTPLEMFVASLSC